MKLTLILLKLSGDNSQSRPMLNVVSMDAIHEGLDSVMKRSRTGESMKEVLSRDQLMNSGGAVLSVLMYRRIVPMTYSCK